jgi:hypothetical protein
MLKDILSISGNSGLYKYLKKSRNGIIVEHLETHKRMNADPTVRVNSLEEISLYTTGEDMELKKVFEIIHKHESGGKAIDPKKASPEELKDYFATVIPDYDDQRVYTSDMKKILSWYNTLHELNMLNFEEAEETENEDKESEKENPGSKDAENTASVADDGDDKGKDQKKSDAGNGDSE